MFAPGGATIKGFEARNTATCVVVPVGLLAVVECAKTTVGKWIILAIIGVFAGSPFSASAAVTMMRPNARIIGLCPDDRDLDGEFCKALSPDGVRLMSLFGSRQPLRSKAAASPHQISEFRGNHGLQSSRAA